MKKTSLAALAALSVLAGCRNAGQEIPATGEKTVHFHAMAGEGTRTAFSEAGSGVYRTLWTDNDREILLSLNYGKAAPSSLTASADGVSATFEASFDAAGTSAPFTFYAVSPASSARAISPSRKAWSVSIAAEQRPSATSVDEAAQLLVAKSASSATLPDEVDIHFSHLTAYGRVTLKNLGLDGAAVRKADLVFATPVVGEWYWGEDGSLASNGASHTITLLTDASADLWFACAPVDVSGTPMTLNVYTDRGVLSKEITFPEGRRFESGKVARFSVDFAGVEIQDITPVFSILETGSLQEGDEILIVNTAGTYGLGAQNDNGTPHRDRVAVTVEDGRILDYAGLTVLTVEAGATAGTWAFHTGTGYLTAAASKNVLQETDRKDALSSWTVTVTDGIASVFAQEGESAFIKYNSAASRFSCFKLSATNMKDIAIYRRGIATDGPVADNPLMDEQDYGCYLPTLRRTYVRGGDQLSRAVLPDGTEEFSLLNADAKEQLVVSGYDPTLAKGGTARVSVSFRKGKNILLSGEYVCTVVKEEGPKVWLATAMGQGFIIKK
ncbi:MAG: hypothetical protein IJ156_02290 [Bacteroidales bacterium]|nr:hypothetical protein [Bacteroidales bacterium]